MPENLIEKIETWSAAVEALDWNGSFETLTQCDFLIKHLISAGLLGYLLDKLESQPELLKQCEQLQGLKKLVLVDDKKRDFRLRLHLFEDYAFDVAHNHKWSFHSTVLHGSYLQHLHGEVSDGMSATEIQKMPVVTATEYRSGDSYFLRHSMVHSLRATPETITLVIRGPIMRKSSLWNDLQSKKEWTHIGDHTDKLKRELSADEVRETVRKITHKIGHVPKVVK